MTRRLTIVLAILAVAAVALLPGVASAQVGSPPAVAGIVIEAPAAPAAPAVAGDALPRTGGALPRTGADVIAMAIGAVVLVLVGSALVVSTRRRQGGTASLA